VFPARLWAAHDVIPAFGATSAVAIPGERSAIRKL
jgi:hypothetical protein